jgi:hypothetical protein
MMNWTQRIARFAFIGVFMAAAVACNSYEIMGGNWADPESLDGFYGNSSNGWVRAGVGNQTSTAYVGSPPCWYSSVGALQFQGKPLEKADMNTVKNFRRYAGRTGACPFKNGIGGGLPTFDLPPKVVSTPGPSAMATGQIALSAYTTDTNGDGFVTGAGSYYVGTSICDGAGAATNEWCISETCVHPTTGWDIKTLYWYYGPQNGISPSESSALFGEEGGLFGDETVCLYPDTLYPAGPEAITGSTTQGRTGAGNIYRQTPGGTESFEALPFELRADLLNSVDTETDVVRQENGSEVVTFNVTNFRVYGKSYSPRGLQVEMHQGNLVIDWTRGPGGRLAAAWLADQLQRFVAAGGTDVRQLRASVTINDQVTVPLNSVGSDLLGVTFATPDQRMVDRLRATATYR